MGLLGLLHFASPIFHDVYYVKSFKGRTMNCSLTIVDRTELTTDKNLASES